MGPVTTHDNERSEEGQNSTGSQSEEARAAKKICKPSEADHNSGVEELKEVLRLDKHEKLKAILEEQYLADKVNILCMQGYYCSNSPSQAI